MLHWAALLRPVQPVHQSTPSRPASRQRVARQLVPIHRSKPLVSLQRRAKQSQCQRRPQPERGPPLPLQRLPLQAAQAAVRRLRWRIRRRLPRPRRAADLRSQRSQRLRRQGPPCRPLASRLPCRRDRLQNRPWLDLATLRLRAAALVGRCRHQLPHRQRFPAAFRRLLPHSRARLRANLHQLATLPGTRRLLSHLQSRQGRCQVGRLLKHQPGRRLVLRPVGLRLIPPEAATVSASRSQRRLVQAAVSHLRNRLPTVHGHSVDRIRCIDPLGHPAIAHRSQSSPTSLLLSRRCRWPRLRSRSSSRRSSEPLANLLLPAHHHV